MALALPGDASDVCVSLRHMLAKIFTKETGPRPPLSTERLLKADTTQFLLTETEEGREILFRVTGHACLPENCMYAYRQFLKKAVSTERTSETQELLQRLRVAEEEMFANAPFRKTGQLNWSEQEKLKEYANTNLKVEVGEELNFKQATKEPQKLFAEERNPMLALDDAVAIEKRSTWQVKGFFQQMHACVKAMPPKQKARQTLITALQQLGVNEAFTVAAYVTGSGGKQIDWVNMPIDMFVGGIASVVEPYLSLGKGAFFQRYIKMAAFGYGKSALEGGIYYFNPLTNTHGHDREDVTLARSGYSASWATANSAIKIKLFDFLLGLQCMYPGAKMTLTNTGIQFAFRAGSSFGYFYLRNTTLDSIGLGRDGPDSNKEPHNEVREILQMK